MLLFLLLAAAAPFPPDVAQRLVGGALTDGVAYARLAELTDTIGPRLSGSAGAAAAVRWGEQKLKQDGLSVRLEPVKVPHWVRGEERGEILPAAGSVGHPLVLTALGGSVGTPAGGLSAEVVEVHSLAEATALGEQARGKIVFYNHAMGTKGGYRDFVDLRTKGPITAAAVGAEGALVRTLATSSLRSPHTGATFYEAASRNVPGAAISTEDADLLHRLLQRGRVSVKLSLGCQWLPDADSFNVVADIRGRELPDEVVVVSAHLDSWDLATGATDDGAGIAIVMEAGRLIAQEKRAPRRTVRVILYMNEENGLAGGKAYYAAHQAEMPKHQAAIEADSGSGRPLSFTVLGPGGAALLKPWLAPLATLGLVDISEGDTGGSDISPMEESGVTFLGVNQDSTHYFETHHSRADTLDKVEPDLLARNAAAFAVLAYAAAEMPERLPRPPAHLPEHGAASAPQGPPKSNAVH